MGAAGMKDPTLKSGKALVIVRLDASNDLSSRNERMSIKLPVFEGDRRVRSEYRKRVE
jgi:hypothetical protein